MFGLLPIKKKKIKYMRKILYVTLVILYSNIAKDLQVGSRNISLKTQHKLHASHHRTLLDEG